MKRAIGRALAGSAVLAVAACAAPSAHFSKRSADAGNEYFSEKEYGVKASPRVADLSERHRRGGGRYQVGKPYKVKGKWYRPKEEPGYSKRGKASWYGAAFDGRLTANGEIYDMTHLTAAHPTMPLPSYARVTNLENGASVVVRVNDRGPYAHGRIIDLSKRAAQLLGYSSSGVANVQVDYVGRAPLDGEDDRYLLASYQPGRGMSSDGLPSGVMLAMNDSGHTPGPRRIPADGLPGVAANAALVSGNEAPPLPSQGPLIVKRPMVSLALGYATSDTKPAAVSAFDKLKLDADAVRASWRKQTGGVAHDRGAYVAVGTFASRATAETMAGRLGRLGRTEIAVATENGRTWYSVAAYPSGGPGIDSLLKAAWDSGADDALVVRP